MAKKSYVNDVLLTETTLAIQQFLIGPYPTTWAPARVSDLTLTALPTGFRHLGAVVEDTPSLKISRNKFQLQTGIPAVLQYQATIGLTGTLEFTLHSSSWRKLQIALGNLTAISSATLMSSITSVSNDRVISISTAPTSACTIGDMLVVALAGNTDNVDGMETVLSSVVTVGASTTTWYVVPPLPATPTTSYNVYRYDRVDQWYGTAENREYTLLGVADTIDGGQIVQEFPRAQIAGDFERNIRPGENIRIPLQFDLFATKRTIRGNDQLILAQETQFPPRVS